MNSSVILKSSRISLPDTTVRLLESGIDGLSSHRSRPTTPRPKFLLNSTAPDADAI